DDAREWSADLGSRDCVECDFILTNALGNQIGAQLWHLLGQAAVGVGELRSFGLYADAPDDAVRADAAFGRAGDVDHLLTRAQAGDSVGDEERRKHKGRRANSGDEAGIR